MFLVLNGLSWHSSCNVCNDSSSNDLDPDIYGRLRFLLLFGSSNMKRSFTILAVICCKIFGLFYCMLLELFGCGHFRFGLLRLCAVTCWDYFPTYSYNYFGRDICEISFLGASGYSCSDVLDFMATRSFNYSGTDIYGIF